MTLATVRSAIVTLVDAVTTHGGISNVYEEEPAEHDEVGRYFNNRVHFWHVKARALANVDSLGWSERRYEYAIMGWIGVSRDDDATDAIKSDVRAANLQDDIVAKLTLPTNRKPGNSLGSEVPVPQPIIRVVKAVGSEDVECHQIEVRWIVQEAT